jgi:hypothetical protein
LFRDDGTLLISDSSFGGILRATASDFLPPLIGDMDADGDVDFDDIDDFVLGLNDPDGYQSTFAVPPSLKGDTDNDEDFDFDDIQGFVTILGASGAGAQLRTIPEPCSLRLLAVGLASLVGSFWRRSQSDAELKNAGRDPRGHGSGRCAGFALHADGLDQR